MPCPDAGVHTIQCNFYGRDMNRIVTEYTTANNNLLFYTHTGNRILTIHPESHNIPPGNFPCRAFGQRVPELDIFRHHETFQVFLAVTKDLLYR
jgi:hypothetical protein